MSNPYDPKEDGLTHLNVWSKAQTELGRLLSNFAHTPFYHPKYGRFASMEAFFYWVSTGMVHDHLKDLYGYLAKKEGKKYPRVNVVKFDRLVSRAVVLKIIQTPELMLLLSECSLPLVHYYVYGNIENDKYAVVDRTEQDRWLLRSIEQARKLIRCLI